MSRAARSTRSPMQPRAPVKAASGSTRPSRWPAQPKRTAGGPAGAATRPARAPPPPGPRRPPPPPPPADRARLLAARPPHAPAAPAPLDRSDARRLAAARLRAHRSDRRTGRGVRPRGLARPRLLLGRRRRLLDRQARRVRPLRRPAGEGEPGGRRELRDPGVLPPGHHCRPSLRRRWDLLALEPRSALRRGTRSRRLSESDVVSGAGVRRLAG